MASQSLGLVLQHIRTLVGGAASPVSSDGKLLERFVMLRKREGTFRIVDIRSDVGALDLRTTPTAPTESTSFRLDAGLHAERLKAGSLDGTIWVETDDPDFPRLAVRVRGRVVER